MRNIERGRESRTRDRPPPWLRAGSARRRRLEAVAKHLNYLDIDSLYAAIGYADVDPENVIRHLRRPVAPTSLTEEVARFVPPRPRPPAHAPRSHRQA